jgi:hypothetical protein
MATAIQDAAADEFVLDITADGKLSFSAVETIEKLRPLGLTKLKSSKSSRRDPALN